MILAGKRQRWIQGRCTTKDQKKWSQLPILILWMVKDQLGLRDNACFSSVCTNWNIASRNYMPKPRNHPALPWIIHMLPKTTSCELLNFSTMEKIVLNTPEFNGNPRILFSRRGWLLLYVFFQPSVVLFNLLTSAKIDIKIPEKFITSNTLASFSFTDDRKHTPQYIVFATIGTKHLILFIVDAGTKTWKKHLHEIGGRRMHGVSLRVVGNHVYLLNILGTTFIFDMVSITWKEVVPWNGPNFVRHMNYIRMTETEEGEIVQIVGKYNAYNKTYSFRMFKLDDNKSGWEELNDINMSWFMSSFRKDNFDLAVKEPSTRTKKIYQLDCKGDYINKMENHGSIVKQAIHVHDIIFGESSMQCEDHGSTDKESVYINVVFSEDSMVCDDSMHREEKYVEWFECSWTNPTHCMNEKSPFAILETNVQWIDLGWIDKVPPSCVGTKLLGCEHL